MKLTQQQYHIIDITNENDAHKNVIQKLQT